jgi:hypothetical protein
MAFNFSEMDLTGVSVSTGGNMLPPGDYVAKITEAKTILTKDKTGHRFEVKFQDTKGGGNITYWMNVNLPGKNDATKIGREQVKSLAYFGGHPTPDKPGDVRTFVGLVVGIHVVKTVYDGKESSEVQYVCDPAKYDPINFVAKPTLTKSQPLLKAVGGDEIPF